MAWTVILKSKNMGKPLFSVLKYLLQVAKSLELSQVKKTSADVNQYSGTEGNFALQSS